MIGDAVNVAARVEAVTRETGDTVLLTEATRCLLERPGERRPRRAGRSSPEGQARSDPDLRHRGRRRGRRTAYPHAVRPHRRELRSPTHRGVGLPSVTTLAGAVFECPGRHPGVAADAAGGARRALRRARRRVPRSSRPGPGAWTASAPTCSRRWGCCRPLCCRRCPPPWARCGRRWPTGRPTGPGRAATSTTRSRSRAGGRPSSSVTSRGTAARRSPAPRSCATRCGPTWRRGSSPGSPSRWPGG